MGTTKAVVISSWILSAGRTVPSIARCFVPIGLLLHVVTPAFNRAVIYSAQQLHNAYIDDRAVEQLSCSPKRGRLTANVFLK